VNENVSRSSDFPAQKCPGFTNGYMRMCNNMSNKNFGEYSVRCNIEKLSSIK